MKINSPESWENTTLETLIDFVIGGDWGKPEDFDDEDFVETLCIRGSEFRNWEQEKGQTASLRKVKKSSLEKRQLQEGDILVEISGGGPEQPVGRVVLIEKSVLSYKPDIPKICTNFLRLVRPVSEVDSKFLNTYLTYFYKSGEVVEYQAGSNNLRNLKFSDYVGINIPIPPLNEQKRIVAKIEELFAELDAGVASLELAQAQLQTYRQALLKHAFEGKLTAQWRAANADKLEDAATLLQRIQAERQAHHQAELAAWKEAVKTWEAKGKPGKKPSKPRPQKDLPPLTPGECDELPQLPAGWTWGKLGWMTTGVEYGTSAKSTEYGTHPVLRMGNIQNAKFDWSDLVYTSDPDEVEKYLLKENDVLFNRTNSPELVGKTAIYRLERPAIFAGYLIRINQIKTIVNSHYLNLFLNSPIAKNHGNRVKTDGVNQSNINGEKLSNYPFPFCSLAEQDEIVSQLDEKLSLVDDLEQEISENLTRAEALRQSILKKAFAGQLVPQGPSDEPASALLACIRAAKS